MVHAPGKKRQIAGSLIWAAYVLMALAWLIAAGIRLSLRDVSPWMPATVLYYASPGPVLMVGALGLGLLCWLAAYRQRMASWCLMGLIVAQCAGADPSGHFSVGRGSESAAVQAQAAGQSYRLMCWNISHLDHGLWGIAGEIKAQQPDVIALIEAGPPTEELRSVWQKHFPDYEITLLGKEMVLMVRGGRAGEVRAQALPFNTHIREVDVELNGTALTVMLVDVYGRPTLSRKTLLDQLAGVIEARSDRPLVIAGDFNTPSDSLLFQPLQARAKNAFAECGAGYAPTWPLPLPVLTIDQIWGNSQIQFLNCRTEWSQVSDHCPILAEFQIVR